MIGREKRGHFGIEPCRGGPQNILDRRTKPAAKSQVILMMFILVLFVVLSTVSSLPSDRYAYAHDCPLQQMDSLETFRALDKNKDGRLNLEEFMAQSWCQGPPACRCQEVARRFFQRVDQNQDGFITIEEHQRFARERRKLNK